jgi:polyisoprenoid-binding protein YceI
VLIGGTHRLGPENSTLSVQTRRSGAASKAGHDLLIHVTAWEATITIGESPADTRIELNADPSSLRVREGKGGMQALDGGDLDNIHQTIDDEVLLRRAISFRSTSAEPQGDPNRIHVGGELTLFGNSRPISFDLTVGDDGAVAAMAVVKQTDWGVKPYSTLFGALKVADEVEVALEGHVENPAT